MGRPVSISQAAEQRLKIVVPLTLADHFCAHLHQHALGGENEHCVTGRAVFS